MIPYYRDDDNRIVIYHGDCRGVLPTLDECSVHCCVTSPPYWGLRDYGTAAWEGGDVECDHSKPQGVGVATSTLEGSTTNCCSNLAAKFGNTCGKCGARRIDSQLGLEQTPDQYVAKMVEVFREVRRVLRDDGTLWLNLGDSYANKGMDDTSRVGGFTGDRIRRGAKGIMDSRPRDIPPGLKPKDLVGIPWRVAFALQADGWYLRSDIIWAKPNPMPESCRDRPTKSHEYLFLMTKSARYYYDADAIAEPCIESNDARPRMGQGPNTQYKQKRQSMAVPAGWASKGSHDAAAWQRCRAEQGHKPHSTSDVPTPATRNRRDVWTIPTQPYAQAHFATFPRKLVEPCIKAGCPADGLVLDPFMGSGTVAEVARTLGNKCIGIELNTEYIDLIKNRLAQEVLPFGGQRV